MTESPTLLRRQLGRFLRECREATGMTIAIAAAEAQLSATGLQRLESGHARTPRTQAVRELCTIYEVSPDETDKAVGLATKAASADDEGVVTLGGMFSDAFNLYASMERSARRIVTFQELVPGLLQTPDYARNLISAYLLRTGNPAEVEQLVAARKARQVMVTRKYSPLHLEVLLHESALHRVIESPRIMAAQMRHLAEISKLPNVSLRVQPFNAGCTWGTLPSGFVVLDFGTDRRGNPVEPPVVYLDGAMSSDLYIENQQIVERYHELADDIRRTALDETNTRNLLRRRAREYDLDR
ncbi:helix-turn-helix domain-containing protein [Nocardia carnea]|uniref:helix-turn-helix domain-containing protein n=1 Tax=Nocardia carnea TaxID=37328 RepID=UPI002456B9B5|nr:helix-turn-helix transcriptional regulator [Nocardia carnea]